jgi:hypothetical protein
MFLLKKEKEKEKKGMQSSRNLAQLALTDSALWANK